MSALTNPPTAKLRDNPEIAQLFRNAESRHLNDAEYQQYLALLPNNADRVAAAKEIMANELAVVTDSIKQVFFLYPFAKYHQLPKDKCIRDVGYVSAYATHSMLMCDSEWFRDKLLLWLKTILQAFAYPAREERPGATPEQMPPYPEITRHADTLPKRQRAVYETYARLLMNYKQVLSPAAFALLEPHLQLAVDILASE